MKLKKLFAFVIAGMMAMSLAACTDGNGPEPSKTEQSQSESSKSESGSQKTDAKGGKIGISMPTKSLERWNRDGSYLEKEFEKAGYNVSLTYSDNKIDQQVKDIEGLIADKVDLLVVAAIDGESLAQVLTEAKNQNIPVIAYDRLIMNTDAISYYVSFDNYTVGKLQGEFVADKLGLANAGDKKFNVEFTGGDPADNNATFFFNGAMDVIKPYIDKGTVVVPSGQTTFEQVGTAQWDTSKALSRFQNILGSYYSNGTQLDAAICSNDVANEAVATLNLGESILKGEKPDESLIKKSGWNFDCTYDTSSYNNGSAVIPSYLLVPVTVTKDNIQKELVDTGYYTMGSDGYPHPVQ